MKKYFIKLVYFDEYECCNKICHFNLSDTDLKLYSFIINRIITSINFLSLEVTLTNYD